MSNFVEFSHHAIGCRAVQLRHVSLPDERGHGSTGKIDVEYIVLLTFTWKIARNLCSIITHLTV